MVRKMMFFGTLLGAASGGPYIASEANHWWQSRSTAAAPAATATPGDGINPAAHEAIRTAANRADAQVAIEHRGTLGPLVTGPVEGLPVHQLPEVLRFDISPDWVYQRWPRKSTSLSNLEYHGVRVPLVTGTQPHDYAGALTYYFGRDNQLERITFRGRTGDTRQLVNLLMQQFGFMWQRSVSAGEQLLEVRWNNRPTSQLKIRPAGVLWSSATHAHYEVDLSLERPGARRFLVDPTPDFRSFNLGSTASGPPPQVPAPEGLAK